LWGASCALENIYDGPQDEKRFAQIIKDAIEVRKIDEAYMRRKFCNNIIQFENWISGQTIPLPSTRKQVYEWLLKQEDKYMGKKNKDK